MAGGCYMGLDVGTQGTKGLILDPEDGVVARAGCAYGLLPDLPSGAAEQHPQTWVDAVASVARSLLQAGGRTAGAVRGVGVSGQQHGLVVLDADGAVVRPAKLWCDTSTASEARDLTRELGRRIPAGFTAPKVLWMQRHEPGAWARVRRVMLPHDYVNLRLTGRHVTDAGDASGTGWFDAAERRYDGAAVELLGLQGLLPEVVAAGEPAGWLDQGGAELLGLPPGIPVAAGSGDNMMSALGAGATHPGRAVVSLGTSATVFCRSPRPLEDPEALIASFCDATGAWLPLLCVMNATGVLEEVRKGWPGKDLEALTREAREVPAGCGGLLFVPYLQGERVPDLPEARGALLGLEPGMLRSGALFRAALEGTALNLAWGLERLRALGLAVEQARLVGGGSGNVLWRRILADALEMPLVPVREPETAALGAALQAAWTARRLAGEKVGADQVAADLAAGEGPVEEPDPAGVARSRVQLARFKEAVAALYGAG